MNREEKIAIIGRRNLKVWPWTRLRTIVLVIFLGLGALFITLGIIFWGHHNAPVGIWAGGIIAAVSFFGVLVQYFYGEVPNFVVEVPMVKMSVSLEILEYHPIIPEVVVAGKDCKLHTLPLYPDVDNNKYRENNAKSYVFISGRSDCLSMEFLFGKNLKEIIVLPK